MAKLDIDINVNGEQKLDNLKNKVDNVDKSTKFSAISIAKWTTAIGVAVSAIGTIIDAGSKFNNRLEDLNDSLAKTKDISESTSTAFGAFSKALLDQIGYFDAYRSGLDAIRGTLDGLALALGGVTSAQIEYLEWQKEEDEYWESSQKEIKAAKLKALEDEDKAYQRLQEATARAFDNAARQLEAEARKEQIELNKQRNAELKEEARLLREAKKAAEAYQAYDNAMYNAGDTTSKDDFMRDLGDRLSKLGQQGVSQERLAALYKAEVEKYRKSTEENTKAVEENTRSTNTNNYYQQNNSYGGGGGGGSAGSGAHYSTNSNPSGLHSTAFSGATAGGAYYGTGGGSAGGVYQSSYKKHMTLQTSSSRDLSKVGSAWASLGKAVNNVTESLYSLEEIVAMKAERDDLIAKKEEEIIRRDTMIRDHLIEQMNEEIAKRNELQSLLDAEIANRDALVSAREDEIYNRDSLIYQMYNEELQSVTASMEELNRGIESRDIEKENLLQERASILEEQRVKALEKEQQAREDLIDSLNETISSLEGISSGLSTNWSDKAREALFGGTSRSLGYAEAKANAEAAWKAFSADTSNGDLLDAYNNRMSELIGTLDDFKDWTKYNSSAEQEFAKIQAQRDIDAMQEGQLEAKDQVDEQLEELKKITEATQNTYDETKRLEDIKKESEYQTAQNARLEEIQRRSEEITKENRDATQEIAVLNERANTLSEQIKSVQYVNKTLSERIAESNDKIKEYDDKIAKSNEAIKVYEDKIEKSNEAIKGYEDKIAGYSYLIKTYDQKIKESNDLIKGYEEKIKELSENIAENQYATAEATKSTSTGSTMPVITPKPPSGGISMYASGGYTGDISASSIAGVVHGREYVLNAQTTKDLGLNENNGGVMKEIRDLMYEQVKTSKKIQSIERQMLKNALEVA